MIVFHKLISNSVPPFAMRYPSLLTGSRTFFERNERITMRVALLRWSAEALECETTDIVVMTFHFVLVGSLGVIDPIWCWCCRWCGCCWRNRRRIHMSFVFWFFRLYRRRHRTYDLQKRVNIEMPILEVYFDSSKILWQSCFIMIRGRKNILVPASAQLFNEDCLQLNIYFCAGRTTRLMNWVESVKSE